MYKYAVDQLYGPTIFRPRWLKPLYRCIARCIAPHGVWPYQVFCDFILSKMATKPLPLYTALYIETVVQLPHGKAL
jgi:hypothetical protein